MPSTKTLKKIDLLGHGHVRLVDYMGGDLAIVRSARISHNAEWRAGDDSGGDAKLIKYLMANDHNTPFESTVFTFDVKAPIFVFRQWHRHRTQSYNEVSARYTPLPEEFYIPEIHLIGKQSTTNKQVRDFVEMDDDEKEDLKEYLYEMERHHKYGFVLYKELLASGMPRELARTVLPVATFSHMFATMNLHNLFRFLTERLHPHAQHEIRVYAKAILMFIEPLAPVAVGAFKEKLINTGKGYEF